MICSKFIYRILHKYHPFQFYQWKFILPASQFTSDNIQYTFINLLATSFYSKGIGSFCLERGGDEYNFAWKWTVTGRYAYQERNSKKSMYYKLFFKKTHNYDDYGNINTLHLYSDIHCTTSIKIFIWQTDEDFV